MIDPLRAALEAQRRDYLAKHDQSVIDEREFGPKAGANGRWKARAEGIDRALEIVAALAAEARPGPSESSRADMTDSLRAALDDAERPPSPPNGCQTYHGVPGCRCQVRASRTEPHRGAHHCEEHDRYWTDREEMYVSMYLSVATKWGALLERFDLAEDVQPDEVIRAALAADTARPVLSPEWHAELALVEAKSRNATLDEVVRVVEGLPGSGARGIGTGGNADVIVQTAGDFIWRAALLDAVKALRT